MTSNNNKAINKKLVVPSEEQPHVVFRQNALVPAAARSDNNNNNLGRETLYEPVLVMSPVYASRRNAQRRGGLITATDVDDLAKHLDAMLLGGATVKEEDTVVVGRYEGKVFSKKAKGPVAVKRSVRLADKN